MEMQGQTYQLLDFDHKQEINVSSTTTLRKAISSLKSYSQELVYQVQYMCLIFKKEDLDQTFQKIAQRAQLTQSSQYQNKINKSNKFIVYSQKKDKKIPKIKENASDEEILNAIYEIGSQLDIDQNHFDAKATSYVQAAKDKVKKHYTLQQKKNLAQLCQKNKRIAAFLKASKSANNQNKNQLLGQQTILLGAPQKSIDQLYQINLKDIQKKIDQEYQTEPNKEQVIKELGVSNSDSQFNQEEKNIQLILKKILQNPKLFQSPQAKPEKSKFFLWRIGSKIASFLEDSFNNAKKKFQSWMDWFKQQYDKIIQFIDVLSQSKERKQYSDYDPKFIYSILWQYLVNVGKNIASVIKGQGFHLYKYNTYDKEKIKTQHVIPWEIPNDYKIGLVGDYGTGQKDAKRLLRELIFQRKVDVIINLGDVYYSGTEEQYQKNIISLLREYRAQAKREILYFQIPGNHDYYSGGKGFYNCIQTINSEYPNWQDKTQTASYFSLRSKDGKWQFLGMDSSYFQRCPATNLSPCFKGTKLNQQQQKWHMDKLHDFSGSTILLSHHQVFSRHEHIIGKITDVGLTMRDLLKVNSNLISQMFTYYPYASSWFWGHQHSMMFFKDNNLNLQKPRLLGNSSFRCFQRERPYTRTQKDPEFPLIGHSIQEYFSRYVPNKSIIKINQLHKQLPHYYDLSYAVIELGQKSQVDYYSISPFEQTQIPNPYHGAVHTQHLQTKSEIMNRKRTLLRENNNEVLIFSSIACNVVYMQSHQAGLSITNKEKLIIQELHDKKGTNGNKIVLIKKILQGKTLYLTCNQLKKARFEEKLSKFCEWELQIDHLFANQQQVNEQLRFFESFKLKNGEFYLCASTPKFFCSKIQNALEIVFGQQVSAKNINGYLVDNSDYSALYGVNNPKEYNYLYDKFMFVKENIVK